MQVEEPVQGPSYSGGVRALVSMELSASNERLDFAFPVIQCRGTATPCVDVRGAEAYGRQKTNEAALSWPEIALLSRDHDPSVHPLAG